MSNPAKFINRLLLISERGIIVFCLLFILLHNGIIELGFYGMDDINYARYAASLKSGTFNGFLNYDHFAHRWLPILITGLFYLVFGINDFSSALFGMLTTLGTCWMIILLTRSLGKKNQILSVLLFLLTYSVIFASHRLWPDTGISFFLLCSLYLYLNRSEHKAAQNSFLFTAGLCCALLCKETVIVFIPLLLFVFIKDLTTNKLKAWWGWTVIWSISFLLLYLGSYKYITGDPLFRYHILQQNNYLNECSYDQLPAAFLLKRIGYELWLAFLRNGDALLLLPAVCSVIYFRKIFKTPNPLAFYFLLLLLSANFMSLSATSYIPICQDPRHFLFIIPLAAIAASCFLAQYVISPSSFILFPILMLAATFVLFLNEAGEIKYIYALASLLVIGCMWMTRLPILRSRPSLVLILFVTVFSIRPLFDLLKPGYTEFSELKTAVNYIQEETGNEPVRIFNNDSFTTEMTEYFLQFDSSRIKPVLLGAETAVRLSGKNNLFIITRSSGSESPENLVHKHFEGVNGMEILKQTNHFILVSLFEK